jgi:hypothetical protein
MPPTQPAKATTTTQPTKPAQDPSAAKRKVYIQLANKRVNAARKYLRLVGQLGKYSPTDAEKQKIHSALDPVFTQMYKNLDVQHVADGEDFTIVRGADLRGADLRDADLSDAEPARR